MVPRAKGWTRIVGMMCALGLAACGETPNGSRSPLSAGTSGSAPTAGASGNGAAGSPSAGAGASSLPQGGAGAAGQPAGGLGGSGGVLGLGGAGISGENGGGAGGAAGTTSSAGATASAGTGQGTAPLALTNLMIEENPNLSLSCFVSWTTAEPASSEVEFGEGGYQFRIRDASLVTEHRVLVIGMHAATAYQLKAVSATALATGSAEGMFTTGALPVDIPTPTLTASDPAASESGWTLTNVQEGSKTKPSMIVMYDEAGLPVWYFIHGPSADTRGDVPATLNAGLVLIGATAGESPREVDLSGAVVWEGPPQSTAQGMSHYVGKTSTGNYLLNRELDRVVQSGGSSLDDQRLEEVTPGLDLVWSWNFFDHLSVSGSREDLCHGNSMHFDEAAGAALLELPLPGSRQDRSRVRRCPVASGWGLRHHEPRTGGLHVRPAELSVQRHSRSGHQRRRHDALLRQRGLHPGAAGER